MTRETESPYQSVLGDLSGLHPRLRDYFGAIPEGCVGVGSGVFQVVGTPRRWLWPILWVLQRQGVLFPVWEREVPFTVVNRPLRDRSGRMAVHAVRTFNFARGSASMMDAITAEPSGLIDHLGIRRRYQAPLSATVADGALTMASTSIRVRAGRVSLPVPKFLVPRVTLVERFDDADDLQHVSVAVDAPLIGRFYEYAGSFRYEIDRPSGQEA